MNPISRIQDFSFVDCNRISGSRSANGISELQHSCNVLVTVLMPCLNEARTLAACIQQAHVGCRAALAKRNSNGIAASDTTDGSSQMLTYEILIADNGSTDGSQAIASAHGARVEEVTQKGYGAALQGGIAAARGKYIVMGDSDESYDFGEVPRFLDKLEEGYDLVIGNRFAGGIMPGAMPWHHRYIGNPILSWIGRMLYRAPCRDWHCGLRAFGRQETLGLRLACPGMEFASEMVIRASRSQLRIAEIPTRLKSDGRARPPHLRSFRDGFRHLSLLLRSSSSVKFLTRGLVLMVIALWIVYFIGEKSNVITVSNPNVDLGVLELNRTATYDITFENHSSSPIKVLGASSTCSCLLTKKGVFTIPANSTCSVAITINPKGIGPYAQSLRFYLSSRQQQRVVVSFVGSVVKDGAI